VNSEVLLQLAWEQVCPKVEGKMDLAFTPLSKSSFRFRWKCESKWLQAAVIRRFTREGYHQSLSKMVVLILELT
jgi:hypothetical protein